jgi:acyl-CoA thioester hydrolase
VCPKVNNVGYALQIRVRYAECDLQGVVFNANYLVYVDDVIERWLTTALPTGDLDYMVKKATIEWSAPARRGDLLDLTASVSRWGRTSYDVEVRGEVSGTEIFTAVMTCINVGPGHAHADARAGSRAGGARRARAAEPAAAAPGVSCVFVCHDGRGACCWPAARPAPATSRAPGTPVPAPSSTASRSRRPSRARCARSTGPRSAS